MSEHGGISIARAVSRRRAAKAQPSAGTGDMQGSGVGGLAGKGFRHFSGDPGDSAFRFDGKLIDHAPKQHTELRAAMMKLAHALEGPGAETVPPEDNPNVPSGYTYMMQFVAHDLVESASSLARTNDGRIALNNGRRAMLRLASIYGDGPESAPLLYTAGADMDPALRSYLRLGPLDTDNAYSCPFRDLARLDLAKTTADLKQRVEDPPPASVPGDHPQLPQLPQLVPLPDVVVADVRNDDNAVVSQLTVLFHLLHNGLVRRCEDVPLAAYADDPMEGAFDRYYFARMATTLIYRNIIRKDLLRRLLHPAVYALYTGAKPPDIDTFDGRMPLELTHGALRVCHAMPRQRYAFNDDRTFFLNEVLLENSADRADRMPLPDFWAVDWSFFFEIYGAHSQEKPKKVNLSRRLGPRYDPQTQVAPLFPPIDETQKPGLAYRDLLSASLAGLWSVPALLARLAGKAPEVAEILKKSKLSDTTYREKALADWLTRTSVAAGFPLSATETDSLAKDPPLPFFLMFEAMDDRDSRGRTFGPLGSFIIAAVVFGILAADPILPGDGSTPLAEQLRGLQRNVFGATVAPFVFPALDTMAHLVRFVSTLHELDHAKPKFI